MGMLVTIRNIRIFHYILWLHLDTLAFLEEGCYLETIAREEAR